MTRRTPDVELHAYNAIIAMPLPPVELRWLLQQLHAAAGQPAPSLAVLDAQIFAGPMRRLRLLRRLPHFGRRCQRRLRAALSAPELSQTLASSLLALTQTEMVIPDAPPLPHPLGKTATFPPLVARALGQEGGLVYGRPRALPRFPFNHQIVHFRDAVVRPPPPTGLIIGAGYIGVEIALAWARAGSSVTLIDQRTELLYGYESEQVATVRALLEEAGVRIWLGVDAAGWRQHGDQLAVAGTRQGRPVLLTADLVLVAVGVIFSHTR
ncbi:MAG: hypothetical protein ACI8S6_004719 [Myxococcota bacterium]|jgi:hypothetical protein